MRLRRGRGDERGESAVGEVEGESGVLRGEAGHDEDGESPGMAIMSVKIGGLCRSRRNSDAVEKNKILWRR